MHFPGHVIVKTLFQHDGRLEIGEVEVKLLPGIPILHLVGLPDTSIKECGIKLKSALRSLNLRWPVGQQIVVSLRPMDLKKSGAGVELAIALAYLAATEQISSTMKEKLPEFIVFGELSLNGEVKAPTSLPRAIKRMQHLPILTGALQSPVRDGSWWELCTLKDESPTRHERAFNYKDFWQRPPLPTYMLHPSAARDLLLAVHLGLSVLVAGPQGTGKTSWARMVHALSPEPDVANAFDLTELFGEKVLEQRWRPFEQPHHSITTQAMIGGGLPPKPGVISRAHGGLLLMDEFLEFPNSVLESLREPMESGHVVVARKGVQESFPARFQLIGTTNLCPCGKMSPGTNNSCGFTLSRCKSVLQRLSGPLLDRFEMLSLSHAWLSEGERVSVSDVLKRVNELREFALSRQTVTTTLPGWVLEMGTSFRRQQAVVKVARGLADLESSRKIKEHHFNAAFDLVVSPMQELRRIFA